MIHDAAGTSVTRGRSHIGDSARCKTKTGPTEHSATSVTQVTSHAQYVYVSTAGRYQVTPGYPTGDFDPDARAEAPGFESCFPIQLY